MSKIFASISQFNDWLGLKITSGVGTMWCAYFFALIAVVGFPFGDSKPKDLVQWFAQTFLQLVLLSIILVGQAVQSKRHEELLQHVKSLKKDN